MESVSVQSAASTALLVIFIVVASIAAIFVWGALALGLLKGLMSPVSLVLSILAGCLAGLIIAAIWGNLGWAFGG